MQQHRPPPCRPSIALESSECFGCWIPCRDSGQTGQVADGIRLPAVMAAVWVSIYLSSHFPVRLYRLLLAETSLATLEALVVSSSVAIGARRRPRTILTLERFAFFTSSIRWIPIRLIGCQELTFGPEVLGLNAGTAGNSLVCCRWRAFTLGGGAGTGGLKPMSEAARVLYDQLRALESRAKQAKGRQGTRREAAKAARRPPYDTELTGQRISSWLPKDPGRAQVPSMRMADQVWALVRVWSEWAGDKSPSRNYWYDLIDRAQPGRSPRAREDSLSSGGSARAEFEAVARGRAVPGGAGAGGEAVAPRMLPRDIASFTGRQQELQELVDGAIGAAESGGVVGIYAVGGMAGIGKTALAVHAAYRMLPQFPDGQLFADLRGYTAGQALAEPGEILDMFLRRLGVDVADLPASVDERSGMLRDRLASKRVLMVLDNAATESQVRPLLPGAGGSVVVITSRGSLAGLEVDHRVGLNVLPADQATVLLASLIGPKRAAAEPEALRQVRDFCGCLPLALQIAGQNLAVRPSWTVARLAEMLTDEQDRLDTLEAGDRQVRSAFMVSYRQLPESDARMFRLLGLHPGPDLDVPLRRAWPGSTPQMPDRFSTGWRVRT